MCVDSMTWASVPAPSPPPPPAVGGPAASVPPPPPQSAAGGPAAAAAGPGWEAWLAAWLSPNAVSGVLTFAASPAEPVRRYLPSQTLKCFFMSPAGCCRRLAASPNAPTGVWARVKQMARGRWHSLGGNTQAVEMTLNFEIYRVQQLG